MEAFADPVLIASTPSSGASPQSLVQVWSAEGPNTPLHSQASSDSLTRHFLLLMHEIVGWRSQSRRKSLIVLAVQCFRVGRVHASLTNASILAITQFVYILFDSKTLLTRTGIIWCHS